MDERNGGPPAHQDAFPPRPGAAPPVSRLAMVGAFLAIIVGGLSGAAIGFGLVAIECEGDCAVPQGLGAIIGGLIGAGGVAVVAVLVLRALAEWHTGGTRRS